MADEIKNLTTPEEIIHAFLIKGSRNAISRFADQSRFSRAYISQHIHGNRRNEGLLRDMANHLGCGIYGVMPDEVQNGRNRPLRMEEEK